MLRSTSLLNNTKAPSSYYTPHIPTINDQPFLRHGIPEQVVPHLINQLSSDELSPLHCAAKNDDVEIIESLIEREANVNMPGLDNMTPLHLAARHNKLLAVQALLSHGANAQAQDVNLDTPLHYAARAGHLEICEAS
ncbi:Ankyrin-1 [Trichoplax sp. H2]|nr:Ankyrin-1 [Trichoplax sp. H2]|eukprot:RDD38690.1 Ankyrin-1 [Trichoplax sp. H2]